MDLLKDLEECYSGWPDIEAKDHKNGGRPRNFLGEECKSINETVTWCTLRATGGKVFYEWEKKCVGYWRPDYLIMRIPGLIIDEEDDYYWVQGIFGESKFVDHWDDPQFWDQRNSAIPNAERYEKRIMLFGQHPGFLEKGEGERNILKPILGFIRDFKDNSLDAYGDTADEKLYWGYNLDEEYIYGAASNSWSRNVDGKYKFIDDIHVAKGLQLIFEDAREFVDKAQKAEISWKEYEEKIEYIHGLVKKILLARKAGKDIWIGATRRDSRNLNLYYILKGDNNQVYQFPQPNDK